jgi:hypothetical protein
VQEPPHEADHHQHGERPSISQKDFVSDGNKGSAPSFGPDSALRVGRDSALMPSSAEGPEGANPGSFPVHPMQNIAAARLLCPQHSQTFDMILTP